MTGERNFPDNLRDLENIFHQLRSNRLKCNPVKCEFAQSKVIFLGFSISSEGIVISDDKPDIIRKMQPPKSVKGVQRIIRMFNYLRKMVRAYSQNTYHMRHLLQKDVEFQWNEHCDKELDYIKTALLSRPTLQPMDPSKDLILQIDGSSYGVGWVAYQTDDNGVLHVTEYGGQATTVSQNHWHAGDLELLALTMALKSVEWLARFKKVIVYADSARVLHLNSWEAVNNRQRRAILYLSQFSLDIRYVPGVPNLPTDALSRIFLRYVRMSTE